MSYLSKISLVLCCFIPAYSGHINAMTISTSNTGIYWILHELTNGVDHVDFSGSLNVDPELIDYTPKQLMKLRNYNLYVSSNLRNEKRIFSTIDRKANEIVWTPVVVSSLADPHFWLSVQVMKELAKESRIQIEQLNPTRKPEYEVNYLSVMKQISAIDQRMNSEISANANDKTRYLIIVHPSLTYLCKEYHLTQVAISTENSNPGLQEIVKIRQLIVKNNIHTIFSEPQFSMQYPKIIAQGLPVNIVQINTLNLDWPAMMNRLITQIARSITSQ